MPRALGGHGGHLARGMAGIQPARRRAGAQLGPAVRRVRGLSVRPVRRGGRGGHRRGPHGAVRLGRDNRGTGGRDRRDDRRGLRSARSWSPPTALCALAAEVRPRFQGGGLADRILDAMSEMGRQAGLGHLIAPVRPSLKHRYPITPIEQYLTWTRENGEPLIHGSGFTFAAVARSPSRSRDRCRSPARSPSGSNGPGCGSRKTGSTFPGRAGAGRDRPRPRPRLLLGAERLDRAHPMRRAAQSR